MAWRTMPAWCCGSCFGGQQRKWDYRPGLEENSWSHIVAVQETPTSGIVFPAVSFGRGSTIVTFTDSSWANAARHASQFGMMILVCPGQVLEKTSPGCVLDWKSGRSRRLCRSKLAAEAVVADEGADRSCFINYILPHWDYPSTSCVWRN